MEQRELLIWLLRKFEEEAINVATYFRGNSPYEAYESARDSILSQPALQHAVPEWIVKNRTGSSFRTYMQGISKHHADRRQFIGEGLQAMYQYAEEGAGQPLSVSFNEVKNAIKGGGVEGIWRKIHLRRETDPEGAITASRTMLESTLKYILDELGEEYKEKDDLPDLYKAVSRKLNLSPEQHHEQLVKQICQGITSIVVGLGTLRNKYGDAHGKGKAYIAPEKRHADLVVNLSATLCVFLVDTLKARLK